MRWASVRPESISDRSGAIILSIDSKWFEPLKSGVLRWVIRKRLPFNAAISHVYFHVKSPMSAIVGRSRICSIERVALPFLLEHNELLQMRLDEIRVYVGNQPTVGLLRFERMDVAKGKTQLAELRRRLEYFPPQSFAFVSRNALAVLDEMCDF